MSMFFHLTLLTTYAISFSIFEPIPESVIFIALNFSDEDTEVQTCAVDSSLSSLLEPVTGSKWGLNS